jgi:hypothetical protein
MRSGCCCACRERTRRRLCNNRAPRFPWGHLLRSILFHCLPVIAHPTIYRKARQPQPAVRLPQFSLPAKLPPLLLSDPCVYPNL